MEDSSSPCAHTQCQGHIAELANRRVRQHLFDVVLHKRQRCAHQGGHRANHGECIDAGAADRQAVEEDAIEACDQVDAGDNHGGGVDQSGDGRRASHSVWQPGVQEELAGLGHDRCQQTQRGDQQQRVAGCAFDGACIDLNNAPLLVRGEEKDDHADQQTDIANTVGQEGLECRV